MYFPYLRGKQNELFAVKELASKIAAKQLIIPIIEPVRENTDTLIRTIKQCANFSAPYVLIVNPEVGELENKGAQIEKLIATGELQPHGGSFLGFLISQNTTISQIESFLKKYSSHQLVFIHAHSISNPSGVNALFGTYSNVIYQVFIDGKVGHSYQSTFNSYPKVLIRDGFKKVKNADYPPDEFFSDLHLSYKANGYKGFGDFTTVGSVYEEGGRAHAVAIHLTYYNDIGDMWIRHFVSDNTISTLNIAEKFLEALVKLIRFLDMNPKVASCESCAEFRDLFKRGHFPQLGPVKKLSIKHHIELIDEIL